MVQEKSLQIQKSWVNAEEAEEKRAVITPKKTTL
jgi:hypothetical protein